MAAYTILVLMGKCLESISSYSKKAENLNADEISIKLFISFENQADCVSNESAIRGVTFVRDEWFDSALVSYLPTLIDKSVEI